MHRIDAEHTLPNLFKVRPESADKKYISYVELQELIETGAVTKSRRPWPRKKTEQLAYVRISDNIAQEL